MSSLADVFRVLNRMRDEGIAAQYAVGGAAAVLFYAEPTRTYDLDVFVAVEGGGDDAFAPLSRIYEWARKQRFGVQAEHLLIEGDQRQLFLPVGEAAVGRFVSPPRAV